MTDTATATLADWLLACIDEDEAAALAARRHGFERIREQGTGRYALPVMDNIIDRVHEKTWQHIGRWDPARVLAECAAKRRIVDTLAPVMAEDWFDPPATGFRPGDQGEQAAFVLSMLALPYADRPGYREEWRP